MLANPPPTGVVTGPFSPTRVRSIDSVSSLGMYSWYFSNASAPAMKVSHSNLRPVASMMRTVACVTSGPMPSPGISVILYDITGACLSGNTQDACYKLLRFHRALRSNLRNFFRPEEVLQLRHKFLHIFEVEINRGKSHVSNFVIAAQPIHNQFADFTGLAFALR